MINEKSVRAEIAEVLDPIKHGNRCYKLKFRKGVDVGSSAFVTLSFDAVTEEREMFFNISADGTVEANIHACVDLAEIGGYYAWQRRLKRMATTCPRCKYRLDRRSRRGV